MTFDARLEQIIHVLQRQIGRSSEPITSPLGYDVEDVVKTACIEAKNVREVLERITNER